MPLKDFLFTSESVSEGHPDKLCDQISDAVLDALLAEDPDSRVALESLAKTGLIVLAGEITSKARPDYVKIARQTAIDIGYNSTEVGFDGNMCAVLTAIEPQSADISQGVTEGEGLHKEQGAGDQIKQRSEIGRHQGPLWGVAATAFISFSSDTSPACAG